MILYAAYVNGGALLDQVAGENEEAALAKLRLDYPTLTGTVEFQIVDTNYDPNPPKKIPVAAATMVEPTLTAAKADSKARPFAVIEADKLDLHITISGNALTPDQLKKLETAAEQGLVISKKKGN